MHRQIDLLVYPTRASKVNGTRAHWALFIPSSISSAQGTLIQVLGTPFTGYGLEFKRGYKLDEVKEKFSTFVLGEVEGKHVGEGDGEGTDILARDEVEREAKKVEVPGVSREPLNPAVGRRCQEWTRELVQRLVKGNILPGSALLVLDEAKRLETVVV
ncbi:hypothetical protein LOCC1_G007789 [Lachnellula occidentalis]|uniref:Uncharacterized protein n=1 Tax=Lachnellula occidentalis TaxID=215460 RepID=A0A8H8RH28_9HELO|nr:hypothetical protein LOCC1_G007789 [Lachnellula occidentalis]